MKSCLKVSPPMTPDLSAPPSPGGSGRTSACGWEEHSRPGMRKAVSFCDEELEEVFFADEWDRSPVPVTPRLSYQDVLELKQLRLSLPRTAPSSAYRAPPPAFPLSRFATQPSHTPDRWRNRSQPLPHHLDPDILPYLDAVPIRLLPLLDNPEPLPTPVPEAPVHARPGSPPRLPSRTANFAFLPLLPVQQTQAPAPPALPPPPASNRFNMTFLPLAVEADPAPPQLAEQDASMSHPHSPPPSTPSLCSASDTDTDLDTDAESDAPSTVASSLPSPPCPDLPDSDDRGYFNVPASTYFSPRAPTSGPGQTPPLSALYPTSPVPDDADATPVENALSSAKTRALRALPSPALAPPSPFTLNPPSPLLERRAHPAPCAPVGLGVQLERPVMTKRMFTAVRTQLHATVSADAGWGTEDGALRPSLSRRGVAQVRWEGEA